MKLTKVVAALAFCVITGAYAGDVVYLKPDPQGTRAFKDGTSWANAYDDVATAVAAAGANPIYAAKGVYKISAEVTVATDGFAIYGGFAGENDSETIAGRDLVNDQTIFSGDVNDGTKPDVWQHVETNGYAVTQTDTSANVVVNGKISLPTVFSGGYDAYACKYDAGNTRRAFTVSSNVGGRFDGIVFTGFTGLGWGNTGSAINYNASTAAAYISNCRFVGCHNEGNNGVVYRTAGTGVLYIEDTSFEFCSAKVRSSAVEALGPTEISRCRFLGCCRPSGNSGANVLWLNSAAGCRVRDSEFVRCLNVGGTSAGDDNDSAPANLVSGMYSYAMDGCVVSNCYTASEFGYGTPLVNLANNSRVGGTKFASNLSLVKPAGAKRGYGMVGTSCRGAREYTFDNCLFVGNEIVAPELDGTCATSYALGVVGNAQTGVRIEVVGCVFDSNAASGVTGDGISPVLCRGVVSAAPTSSSDCQVGVANCTFTGPSGTGMYDMVQYGQHNRYLYIANTLFLLDDNAVANPFSFEVPSKVDLYSCTVQNMVTPPAGIHGATNYEYDKVPLSGYVPQVRVPGIRETADVSTNNPAKVGTTYAIRPYGEEGWKELVYVDRSVTASPTPVVDAKGDVRTFGGATRGAYQTMSALAEDPTARVLVVRCAPPNGGSITAGSSAQMVAISEECQPVSVGQSSQHFVFTGWYDEYGCQIYDGDHLAFPAQEMTGDLVVEARFEAAQNFNVTYDLGIYGGFLSSGENAWTVSCSPGAAFPAPQAYTNAADWIINGWLEEVPETVPSSNVTIHARGVTKDLRIVYLVPADEATPGADGTSWAKAYGDFGKAYVDAAACRGEVWIKKGVHVVTKGTTFLPNVEAVRGGFNGDEDDAADADPENNVTVLTGDASGNNYWIGPDGSTNLGTIWDGDEYSVPEVTTDIGSYFRCGGNNGDDTMNLLIAGASPMVTNVLIDGVTVTGFGNAALDVSASGCSGLVIRRCRFIANNTKQNASVSVVHTGAGSVGAKLSIVDTLFLGNTRAIQGASNALSTNLIANCRFENNYAPKSGASLRAASQFQVCVTNCDFVQNFAYSVNVLGAPDDQNEAVNTPAISLVGLRTFPASSTVVDTRFVDNRTIGAGPGAVAASGDHTCVNVIRCAFTGNRGTISGDSTASPAMTHAACIATRSTGRTLTVRDSYFADNFMNASGTGRHTASVFAGVCFNTTFLNCTFERNAMANATASQISGTVAMSANIGFANCVFNENLLSGASEFTVVATPAFTLLNSTVRNTADGYAAFALPDGVDVLKYDSRVSGTDAKVPAVKAAKTRNGATACGIVDKVLGRPLYLGTDGQVYFKNDSSTWRCLTSASEPTTQTLSNAGVSDGSPIVRDAFGEVRKANNIWCAPIVGGLRSGLVIVVR